MIFQNFREIFSGFGILGNPYNILEFLRAAPNSNVLRYQRPRSKLDCSGVLPYFMGPKNSHIPAFWERPIAFRVPEASSAIHLLSVRPLEVKSPDMLLGVVEFLWCSGILDKQQL